MVCRTASRNAKLVDLCHEWVMAADDHTGLSAKIKKERLQWACDHQHWTIEEWKNILLSNLTEIKTSIPAIIEKEIVISHISK